MTDWTRIKKEFSEEDRTRLRSVIKEYMGQHDIGAPALRVRIAQATGRSPNLIPLKTLQRFLDATHRTNDPFLVPCFQFAETVRPKPAAEMLSEAASAFFNARRVDGLDALAGRWAGAAAGNKTGITVMRTATGEDLTSVPVSELVFQRAGDALSVRETVLNPEATRNAKYDGDFRHTYDGIALRFDTLIYLVLKNTTTLLPRSYWLQWDGDRRLTGHGVEALLDAGPARTVTDLTAYKFERAVEEDQQ